MLKIVLTIGCSYCSFQLPAQQLESRLSVYWDGSENFEGGAASIVLIFLNLVFFLLKTVAEKVHTVHWLCNFQAGSSLPDWRASDLPGLDGLGGPT